MFTQLPTPKTIQHRKKRPSFNSVYCLTSFLLAITPGAFANSHINSYLSSALVGTSNTHEVDTSINTANSWLEGAQFRTSLDSEDKQSYQLRLEPKNRQQVQTEKELLQLYSRLQSENINFEQSLVLKGLYLSLISTMQLKQRLSTQQAKLQLIQEEIGYYQRMVQTQDFNPEKLQKLTLEKKSLLNQITTTRVAFQNTAHQSNLDIKYFDLNQWVNPKYIRNYLSSHEKTNTKTSNPEIETALLKLKIAQAKRERMKSKQGFGVNLLQLEYEDSNKNSTSIGVGFRIPLGEDRFSNIEQGFNLIKIQDEIYSSRAKIDLSIKSRKLTLHNLQNQLTSLNRLESDINQRLAKSNKLPMFELMVNLKNQKLLLAEQRKDIHLSLIREYIYLLHDQGTLTQKPFRNWLLKGQPTI